jgi:hypothetical protein
MDYRPFVTGGGTGSDVGGDGTAVIATDNRYIKLKNQQGEWCYIYPNTAQTGIIVHETEPTALP